MSWFLFCWIRYYVSIWMMVRPSWWNCALLLLCCSVQTCSLSSPLLMDFMIAQRKIMLFAWVCEWYLAVVVFYLLQILYLVYVFFIFRCFFSILFNFLSLFHSRLFFSFEFVAHCDHSRSFVVACIYMCKLIVYT